VREYAPGDRIRFTIEFTHKDNIPQDNVWAVFSYTGSEETSLPEFVIQGRITHQDMPETIKHSLARFISEPISINAVTGEAPGGVYGLTRVGVKTYGGVEKDLTGSIPSIQFQLSQGEPGASVEFQTFEWETEERLKS